MKFYPTIKKNGFTLMELVVVIGVVVIILGLLLPVLVRGKRNTPRLACVANLRQIGLAFRIWAGDHEDRYPMGILTNAAGKKGLANDINPVRYFQIMSNELSTTRILVCRTDTRRPATNFTALNKTNISYFIGLDADVSMPQMFLAGDRNLIINGSPAKTGEVSLTSKYRIELGKAMHQGRGNIALADGSVQELNVRRMVPSGTNVIRLAFP